MRHRGGRWEMVRGCRRFLEGEYREGGERSHQDRGYVVGALIKMTSPFIVRHTLTRITSVVSGSGMFPINNKHFQMLQPLNLHSKIADTGQITLSD